MTILTDEETTAEEPLALPVVFLRPRQKHSDSVQH